MTKCMCRTSQLESQNRFQEQLSRLLVRCHIWSSCRMEQLYEDMWIMLEREKTQLLTRILTHWCLDLNWVVMRPPNLPQLRPRKRTLNWDLKSQKCQVFLRKLIWVPPCVVRHDLKTPLIVLVVNKLGGLSELEGGKCCDCELRTDYFLYLWFLLCNIMMSLCIYKCMHFSDF